jgi:hypothetical protein
LATNKEAIFVRQFKYPDLTHMWDALNVPKQLEGPQGNYSSETLPTLNFVEMFEGFPKNPDGTIHDDGCRWEIPNLQQLQWISLQMQSQDLRATVILPGDQFKGVPVEVRRGIFNGSSAGGLSKLTAANTTAAYPTSVLGSATVLLNNDVSTFITLSNGTKISRSGLSGVFTNIIANATGGTYTGFYLRKYLSPEKPQSETIPGRSDQWFMEFRYGEVVLNKAEAAYELFLLGQGGSYATDALTAVNSIRDRAGASALCALSLVSMISAWNAEENWHLRTRPSGI